MSYITAWDLTKTYGRGEAETTALKDVSFEIGMGEFVAVMGPSGSGKSTLLSLLGALNTPTRGGLMVDQADVFSLNSDRRADFRRKYLGFVFQNFHLVPYLTLVENVMLPLAVEKLKKRQKQEKALEALSRVGLQDKGLRLPGEVSGGEQERTAVARALVNRPPILLADEPTGNLDLATGQEVMNLLSGLNEEGMTIIMVTHSARHAKTASRIMNMADGGLVDDSAPIWRAA